MYFGNKKKGNGKVEDQFLTLREKASKSSFKIFYLFIYLVFFAYIFCRVAQNNYLLATGKSRYFAQPCPITA